MSEYQTFQGDGFSIDSNTRTTEQMTEAFAEAGDKKAKEALGEEVEETPETKPGETAKPPEGKSERQIAKHDMKARMSEATRKESEAKAEAAKERAEKETIRSQRDEIERRAKSYEDELAKLRAPKEESKPVSVNGRPRPTLDEYKTLEDFTEALTDWKEEARDAKRKETADAEAKEASQKAQFETRQKKVVTFMEGYKQKIADDPLLSDAEVVSWVPVQNLPDPAKADQKNFIAQQFIERPQGLDLLVFFKDHPEEATRIASLNSPMDIEIELRIIEKGLGAITATPKPESSKAAPPARPVAGGPPSTTSDPSKMSFEQYARWQEAEDKKARSSR